MTQLTMSPSSTKLRSKPDDLVASKDKTLSKSTTDADIDAMGHEGNAAGHTIDDYHLEHPVDGIATMAGTSRGLTADGTPFPGGTESFGGSSLLRDNLSSMEMAGR